MRVKPYFVLPAVIIALSIFVLFLLLAPRSLHDLHVYADAVNNWTRGQSVYHDFLVSRDPWGKEFAYPPPALLFFYAFTLLPFNALTFLWDVLNIVFLFVCSSFFAKHYMPENHSSATWAVFCALMFSYPVLSLFILGQTGLLVLFILTLTLRILRTHRGALAALPLALLSLVKLYPVFFALLFLKQPEKKVWLSFAMLLFSGILSTALLFPRETKEFATRVLPKRAVIIPAPSNQSLDAFFARTFSGDERLPALLPLPRAARILSVLSKLVMIFVLLAFFRKFSTSEETLCFLILTYLIFAPLVWLHYYVLFAPVLFWFAKHWAEFYPAQKRLLCLSLLPAYTGLPCYAHGIFPIPLNNVFISTPLFGILYAYGLFLHSAKEKP